MVDAEFSSNAKNAALRAATGMFRHDPGYTFSLIGQTTVGKTMLMKLLRGWWNRYVTPYTGPRETFHAAEWIDWPNHDWKAVEDAKDSRFVIIDEFGRGRSGAATSSAWDRLIDFLSYREGRGYWTGMTAQMLASELERADAALYQRLRRNGSVCIQAPSAVKPYTDRKQISQK